MRVIEGRVPSPGGELGSKFEARVSSRVGARGLQGDWELATGNLVHPQPRDLVCYVREVAG